MRKLFIAALAGLGLLAVPAVILAHVGAGAAQCDDGLAMEHLANAAPRSPMLAEWTSDGLVDHAKCFAAVARADGSSPAHPAVTTDPGRG